jgi:hypothetical protein
MQHAGARESENDCGNESRGGEGCPFIDPRRGEVMGGGDSTGCWIDEERGGAVQRHDYSRARGGQLTVGRSVAAAW